jgi:putative endonuclease
MPKVHSSLRNRSLYGNREIALGKASFARSNAAHFADAKVPKPSLGHALWSAWLRIPFIADLLNRFVIPHNADIHEAGRLGERLAEAELRRRGCSILARNYTCRGGEIDLVCRDKNTLVFVEVKTRGEGSWRRPAEAVTKEKRKRLLKAGWAYLMELPQSGGIPVRYDIVEVFLDQAQGGKPEINVIQDSIQVERYWKNKLARDI